MQVPRQNEKAALLALDKWWTTCPFSRVSPPRVAREMGVWPGTLDTLPRDRKRVFGDLYLLRSNGEVHQANLYIPEAEALSIEELERRVRQCPMLATGSLEVPTKPAGGHISSYNFFFSHGAEFQRHRWPVNAR